MKHSYNNTLFSVTKVNSLLPTDTFIMVMKGLMSNRLPSVRRKAMELLNNKLQHKTKWEEQQVRSPARSLTHWRAPYKHTIYSQTIPSSTSLIQSYFSYYRHLASSFLFTILHMYIRLNNIDFNILLNVHLLSSMSQFVSC